MLATLISFHFLKVLSILCPQALADAVPSSWTLLFSIHPKVSLPFFYFLWDISAYIASQNVDSSP